MHRKIRLSVQKGEHLHGVAGFENGGNFSTGAAADASLPSEHLAQTADKYEMTTNVEEEKSSAVSTEEGEDQLDYVTSLTNDIICSHGKVVPDEKMWVPIGEDAWRLIEKYFPATEKIEPIPQIISNSTQAYDKDYRLLWEECEKCRLDAENDASLSNHVKELLKPYERG